MKTILLLIEHHKNRHLLAQWLQESYKILSPTVTGNFAIEGEYLLTQKFDLCFIDFAAIRQLRPQMLAKRESEIPLFLPFVFLTILQDIGFSTDHLEQLIDDIVYIPIQKIELQTKLRVLLRSRSYSLQLQETQAELNQNLLLEKELNELKSEFVSTVSHEFRNPLNSISGMTQILKAYGENLSSAKKAEVLEQLQRNISKMTNMIDNLLAISRKDLGKLEFKPEPLELANFCRSLISEIQTVFQNKQTINFVYLSEQTSFNLDRQLLHPVLSNLISNACKYSPENTVIDFEVSVQNAQLTFIISDRGIGIPSQDIPQLFNSFYRASNSHGYQGTGLGLSIVKQYVELHQGKISVESQLKQGTKFQVLIPI